MKNQKIFNAKIRQAVLAAKVEGIAPAEIQEALAEVWDKCAPEEFVLLKFNLLYGQKMVEQKIVANERYMEDFGCTNLSLCEKSLKRVFGQLPEISKENVVLYSDDATLLYQDINEFVKQYLGSEHAAEIFFDEMQVKTAENTKNL